VLVREGKGLRRGGKAEGRVGQGREMLGVEWCEKESRGGGI
jgi:hypothetical protein